MNLRLYTIPIFYLIFVLLFLPSGDVRTMVVEKELFFEGINLTGLAEVEAKEILYKKLKDLQEELITIREGDLLFSFKKNEVCHLEPSKIIKELIIDGKEPLLNCSVEEFSELLKPEGFSQEAINYAYGKLLEGFTEIEVPEEILTPLREKAFLLPIRGAVLPLEKSHLPNSPRPYRAGVHHGVDFYDGYVGVEINFQTNVFAAYGGEIIRVDHNYKDLSYKEWKKLSQESIKRGYTLPTELDKFMGRQIHIRHNSEVITVYAHLSWIRPDLKVGDLVNAGELIGLVGSSGTGGDKPHLHFEVWVNNRFLGAGLTSKQARELYYYYFKEW